MAKKPGAVFLLAIALVIGDLAVGATSAMATTAKAGLACPKVGTKSGNFICTKVNSKLIWQIVKKTQKITATLPAQINVTESPFDLVVKSSANLAVTSVSNSPQICTIAGFKVFLGGTAGICSISFTQAGNSVYSAAAPLTSSIRVIGINIIDFQMPAALLLNQHTYTLTAKSSSGLLVAFQTSTPDICTVSENLLTLVSPGECAVEASQPGTDGYPAAAKVVRLIEISADRVTADVQDTLTGFQIKAIYVVPSDGVDHAYDTNGVIDSVLNAGTAYLKEELGLTFPIDSTSEGYDITYLHSSKSSDYFLNNTGAYTELMKEIGFLDSPSPNRKDFVFFVDTKTIVGPNYCGEASMPGNSAVVAIGLEECGKKTAFFNNYASQTWVHEVFHNLGLPHVASACDLMFSGQSSDGVPCPPNQRLSIDINHTMYVGANVYGQDLLKLRVWNTYTGNKDLYADCWLSTVNGVPRADGVKYALCPTGTTPIGLFSFCWQRINSVQLEEQVNGLWVSLGTGDYWNTPWGSRVNWRCDDASYVAPWKSLTVLTPGLRHYRWIVNGAVAEEFNIIWQN